MRPQNNGKRGRSRGRKGGGHNQMNRTLESNGPNVKIRGSAAHIHEKYLALSRDAHSAGERIDAENYLQHAEHYHRVMMAAMPPGQQPPQINGNADAEDAAEAEAEAEGTEDRAAEPAAQAAEEGAPRGNRRLNARSRRVGSGQRNGRADREGDGAEANGNGDAAAEEGEANEAIVTHLNQGPGEDADEAMA